VKEYEFGTLGDRALTLLQLVLHCAQSGGVVGGRGEHYEIGTRDAFVGPGIERGISDVDHDVICSFEAFAPRGAPKRRRLIEFGRPVVGAYDGHGTHQESEGSRQAITEFTNRWAVVERNDTDACCWGGGRSVSNRVHQLGDQHAGDLAQRFWV
jgi:hypothetical protein